MKYQIEVTGSDGACSSFEMELTASEAEVATRLIVGCNTASDTYAKPTMAMALVNNPAPKNQS